MVATDLSNNEVGKLIFVAGAMNSFSYNQTLEFYKEDIERLGKDLYFQQDNASCHTGKKSLNFIKNNFNNYFEFWSDNSPVLSPIEELWSIVEARLNKYTFNNTDEMMKKLQWRWSSIPKTIRRNLINSFDEKIGLLNKDGERVNKRRHKSIQSNYYRKINWNNNDYIERIVFNNNVLEQIQRKKIKNLKKELNDIHESLVEEIKGFHEKIKKKSKINQKNYTIYF